jgi:hypothetical protein
MENKSSEIVKSGLLVGTLDILSAFIYYVIQSGKKDVFIVLKYVASGLFGKEAFSGGNAMALAGLLLHYSIAFVFTLFLFWLFPRIKVLSKNKMITGIVYGVFIWMVMNLFVVPFSNIGKRPFDAVNAIINMLILIVCIGIPLSIRANNFYTKRELELNTTSN